MLSSWVRSLECCSWGLPVEFETRQQKSRTGSSLDLVRYLGDLLGIRPALVPTLRASLNVKEVQTFKFVTLVKPQILANGLTAVGALTSSLLSWGAL